MVQEILCDRSAYRRVDDAKYALGLSVELTVSVTLPVVRSFPRHALALLDDATIQDLINGHAEAHPHPENPYRFQISSAVRYCCHGVASYASSGHHATGLNWSQLETANPNAPW